MSCSKCPMTPALLGAVAGAAVGGALAYAYAQKSAVQKKGCCGTKGSFKVCVCGGAGGIGQPLSMLMAMNPLVGELCVYD
eukprot:CAMPEP_0197646694 /NCGR_PEP_ID=MMETSP1338-20131121/23799_1 /TAXON_ID=43686 ORGANISM="Pelagodinium beii, Strain RCC1491" /NCGR_SAMPLE_ID=MMETSP1338 /ASSEMBLY_ACC=CAM_ASM_000754 /LENGTH=79 /DNA_ID=CAMNT_0043220349 /DNA_START=66 /DNA_END=302 /DNA_ORIENTATION=-